MSGQVCLAITALIVASQLAGCANDTGATALERPSYLGAGLGVMGGARSQAEPPAPVQQPHIFIEPTSSSKVLSAIVFERVTGRTAYPDGPVFSK